MATIPATLPTTIITTGEAWTLQLSALYQGSTERFNVTGHTLPSQLQPKSSAISATTITGTPTHAGIYTVPLVGRDAGGDSSGQADTLAVHVTVPGHELIIPTGTEAGDMSVAVPLDTAVSIPLTGFASGYTRAWSVAGAPAWLTVKPFSFMVHELRGTATEGGTWTLTLTGVDAAGDDSGDTATLTVTAAAPATVIPVPAAEGTEDGYMLPEAPGVRWLVDGEETPPGSYSVQPVTEETTVTIIPEALAGYVFDAEPEALVLTFTPPPDPGPDPEDPEGPEDPEDWLHLLEEDPQRALVASTLAPRALRHAGIDPDAAPAPAGAMAEGHLATVLEYVKGYTRGRGFHGYVPERPLQAVIIAATGRLVTNPEQVTYYSTGDYSERPATLTGWTLAELQVLRRYRRVTA